MKFSRKNERETSARTLGFVNTENQPGEPHILNSWNRRSFLASLGAVTGASAWPVRLLAGTLPNQNKTVMPDWQRPLPKPFSEPAWLDEGIVIAGNWEPLVYRIRRGGQSHGDLPVNIDEVYETEHSEETLLKLKQAGVNFIMTSFYKTGLKSDHDDIEVTKKFVPLCRKHGFKVGLYVGGSIFAETLVRDVPEAKQWISRDEYGVPIRYGIAPYRYVPDFNNPGYVDYMKRVLRVAVLEIKPDLFHFDNMTQHAPPETGNSPEIDRRFLAFLREKYAPEQLKERFGFSDISAVTVPYWHGIAEPSSLSPIDDPVIQEWIDFRCQDLANYYRTLADYVRQLNPNIALELNCAGIYGVNRAYLNGVDHVRLVTPGSVFVSEELNEAQVDSNGILISAIRSLKLARSLNVTLFSRTGEQRANPDLQSYRLQMAESMAFNRNSLGIVADTVLATFPDELLRYVRFYHDQNQHFRVMDNVCDVGILRSFPSMAYNSQDPEQHITLIEQLLIQYKVPFNYVFDQNLGDLSRYRVLILADQESLSDQAIEQITAFVRGGGNLLATGRTSLYNDWRRMRLDYGLADVLGIHAGRDIEDVSKFEEQVTPAQVAAIYKIHTGQKDTAGFKRGTFGAGRVAYVRDVIPGIPISRSTERGGPSSPGFGSKYWKLPANAEDLMEALRYVEGQPFPIEFKNAPLTTVAELMEKRDGSKRVLHWVNYQLPDRVPATDVTVAIGAGKRIKSVELISPDRPAQALQFTVTDGRVGFTVPELEVYNIAVISLE